MKDSQDLLTNFNLLTEEQDIYCGRGFSIIELGCFTRKDNPSLFQKLDLIFGLNPKTKQVTLNISNVEYFDFFDDDDNVNIRTEDAPKLSCSKSGFLGNEVYLSKNDAILLAKFIMREQEEIIEETKGIIKELERIENELY